MIFFFVMRCGDLIQLDASNLEVSYLRKEIGLKINVPDNYLILIANGGLCISDGSLNDYDCGDEHNPLFVFVNQNIKVTCEQKILDNNEEISKLEQTVQDLKIKSEKSRSSLTLLVDMDDVGIELADFGSRVAENIETSIREQFLLVEGWSAAVANLSDSINAFDRKLSTARNAVSRFQLEVMREPLEKSLTNQFSEAKEALEKVPILPVLVSFLEQDNITSIEEIGKSTNMSIGCGESIKNLLDWVECRDRQTPPQVTLQSLVDDATKALQELNGVDGLISKTQICLDTGNRLIQSCPGVSIRSSSLTMDTTQSIEPDTQSIDTKGSLQKRRSYTDNQEYCQRLEKLSQIRKAACDANLALNTHREYMDSVVRQCANSLGKVVLDDHCAGAASQTCRAIARLRELDSLLANSMKSKRDLVENVSARAKWLEEFETRVCTIDETLFLTRNRIKRVRTGLRVVEQMRAAPDLYARSLFELARRRTYFDLWQSWGCKVTRVVAELRRIHLESVENIAKELDHHFLQALFHPLSYRTPLPPIGGGLIKWSQNIPVIPNISNVDLKKLSNQLPILVSLLESHSLDAHTILQTAHQSVIVEDNMKLNENNKNNKNNNDDVDHNDKIIDTNNTDLCQPHLYPCTSSIRSIKTQYSNIVSYDSLNLSLLPVPKDGEQLNAVSSDNTADISTGSSRLFQSINSQEFQLGDEKPCNDSDSFQLSINSQLDQLKASFLQLTNEIVDIKHGLPTHIDNLFLDMEKVKQLVNDLSSSCDLNKQLVDEMVDNECQCDDVVMLDNSCQTIEEKNAKGTNSVLKGFGVHFIHREFNTGDPVLFLGKYVASRSNYSNSLHWQMMSTDGRIYYLHDDCIPKPEIQLQLQDNAVNSNTSHQRRRGESESNLIITAQSKPVSVTPANTILTNTTNVAPSSPTTQLMTRSSHHHPAATTLTDQNSLLNDPRSPPILTGIFQCREEYICKKRTNRYGLPENTRFFRVKAQIDVTGNQ